MILIFLLCTLLRSYDAYLLPGMGCAFILPVSSGSGGEAYPPDLNELQNVVFEQRLPINDSSFITLELHLNELESLINCLPKEELYPIIQKNSIQQPLIEFTAEQQEELRRIAMDHFIIKNEIIMKMKSLYPDDDWELTRVMRDKFFCGRTPEPWSGVLLKAAPKNSF